MHEKTASLSSWNDWPPLFDAAYGVAGAKPEPDRFSIRGCVITPFTIGVNAVRLSNAAPHYPGHGSSSGTALAKVALFTMQRHVVENDRIHEQVHVVGGMGVAARMTEPTGIHRTDLLMQRLFRRVAPISVGLRVGL